MQAADKVVAVRGDGGGEVLRGGEDDYHAAFPLIVLLLNSACFVYKNVRALMDPQFSIRLGISRIF